jgi:hypothetical protein
MATDFQTQCQIAHVLLNMVANGERLTEAQETELRDFLYEARWKMEKGQPVRNFELAGLPGLLDTAYGWTIDVYGEIHGLVAGDMGYEGSKVFLKDLVEEALTVAWQRQDFGYEEKLGDFIRESVRVIQSSKASVEEPTTD